MKIQHVFTAVNVNIFILRMSLPSDRPMRLLVKGFVLIIFIVDDHAFKVIALSDFKAELRI